MSDTEKLKRSSWVGGGRDDISVRLRCYQSKQEADLVYRQLGLLGQHVGEDSGLRNRFRGLAQGGPLSMSRTL